MSLGTDRHRYMCSLALKVQIILGADKDRCTRALALALALAPALEFGSKDQWLKLAHPRP